ncbi:MAG: SUMF1/EgtB/PvdO family nonheme iron enzyme [Gammaproteobacteria bacterium]
MRGGSWINHARRVRSAYRNANHPGNANDNLGFRLCLSSMARVVWTHRAAWTRPRVPLAVACATSANRKAPGAPVGTAADAPRRTPPGSPSGYGGDATPAGEHNRTGAIVRSVSAHPARGRWAMADRYPDPFPPPFAAAWGDDAHGLWAEFELPRGAEGERVVQRLRWIEPGTCLMGSPEDEPERDSNEGPRHTVTLTRGFWLADSACTQRIWRAVMGSNPSRFTGDEQRPVEQVSWHDVQAFLQKLQTSLPGCIAGLPTEAEWEYACRAGSDTPFSLGANITPEVVNYDGNYPYAGGEKGLCREETVAVKSLPPNAWGLYEMHGNVWEWCADGLRPYSDQEEVDPVGSVDERALRAVRGGSWIARAGRVRSAARFASPPGFANALLGFRLCLRSIEPGQAPGRPGGPVGLAPGGRAVSSPPRDEAGSTRSPRGVSPGSQVESEVL